MFQMILGVLALVGLTAGQATANTVSLTQPNPIFAGGTATLDLVLEGTNFTDAVDGAAFTFSWDPTVLQYIGMTVANPPWDTAAVNDANAAAGIVDFVFLGQSVGASTGQFGLATLSFNVIGATGTDIVFADSSFGGFVAPGGIAVPVTYVNAQVFLGPIPVPAAVWLFGSGLLGLLGIARRRKAA